MVLRYQSAADGLLIAGRLVSHLGDELARPYVLLGVPVAVETPLHLERVLLPGERHSIHSAVARLTSDALINVNAVIEINEIRQIVHPGPPDRIPRTEAGPYRLERRTRVPDLRMAIHASLGRRNVGEPRGLDRGVTIPAVDSEAADMVSMAERHRLFARLRGAGFPCGSIDLHKSPRQKSQDEDGAENRDSRKRVRAVMKDLGHGSIRVPIP